MNVIIIFQEPFVLMDTGNEIMEMSQLRKRSETCETLLLNNTRNDRMEMSQLRKRSETEV